VPDVKANDDATLGSLHAGGFVVHDELIAGARQDQLIEEEAVGLVNEASLELLLEVVER
jgi:hypothetical protein